MIRTGVIFGVLAALAFTAGLFIPLGGFQFFIAFGALIALGWGAGYTAAKTGTGPGRGIGRGAAAGAIAGAVVLVLSTLAFLVVANTAFFQDLVREALQQNPGIVDPNTGQPTSVDPTTAALIGGAGGGFCLGLISLVLMFIGGAIGGLMWKGVPSIANTGGGAYGSTRVPASEGHVRVYDQHDPGPQ